MAPRPVLPDPSQAYICGVIYIQKFRLYSVFSFLIHLDKEALKLHLLAKRRKK